MSFGDRDHGWAYNSRCNQANACFGELWATRDGGDVWTKSRTPPAKWNWMTSRDDPTTGAASSVVFADERIGWLFDPSLYVTRDGGRNWMQERHVRPVRDLSTHDGWVWALEHEPCPGTTHCFPDARILRSPVTGRLQPLAVQPTGVEGAEQLVAVSANTAYVVRSTNGSRDKEVLATDDGGVSRRRGAAPCRGDGVHIEQLSHDRLWLRCARVHLSTLQFESLDGGRTWAPAPPITAAPYASGPVAISDGSILYEKGDGGGLRRSTDHGMTDEIVFPTRASAGGRAFIHDFVRADRDHLWMITVDLEGTRSGKGGGPVLWAAYSLLRSDDGGRSWRIAHVT